MKKLQIVTLLVLSLFLTMASCSDSGKKEAGKTAVQPTKTVEVKETPKDSMATVIDFYASWCGPCRKFAPIFQKMEEKYKGKINFQRVDVDENPDMVNKYGIESIPTVVILPVKGETKKFVGAMTESDIDSELQKLIPVDVK